MIAKAESRYVRMSSRKVRQVLELIRKEDATDALAILSNLNKRAKEFLIKILKQAIANAKVKGIKQEQLYISKAVCNIGPSWKRYKAAAFGRASPIKKRTCHIKIELDIKQENN
ncbi:MAG: 50S ribosomal protein L22 [Candidatus Omnitrophota bacterium]|jgi:large subunit ribosomal protein L22|nr:MAG: 50S ribosomal protein L22 [Candidatus Omnitrophota bacterium]